MIPDNLKKSFIDFHNSMISNGILDPKKAEIRDVFRRLRHILWHTVTVIMSAREAQARRMIQFYFDDRLIDELTKTGKRIAKKEVKD